MYILFQSGNNQSTLNSSTLFLGGVTEYSCSSDEISLFPFSLCQQTEGLLFCTTCQMACPCLHNLHSAALSTVRNKLSAHASEALQHSVQYEHNSSAQGVWERSDLPRRCFSLGCQSSCLRKCSMTGFRIKRTCL